MRLKVVVTSSGELGGLSLELVAGADAVVGLTPGAEVGGKLE